MEIALDDTILGAQIGYGFVFLEMTPGFSVLMMDVWNVVKFK